MRKPAATDKRPEAGFNLSDVLGDDTVVTATPLPAQDGPRSPDAAVGSWSIAGSLTEPCNQVDVTEEDETATYDSDDSESSSGSDAESCGTEVLEEQASTQPGSPFLGTEPKYYQHKKSKVVHIASLLGTSFTCGRQLTAEHRRCLEILIVDPMRCQQCCRRAASRTRDDDLTDMQAVVKRAKHS